MVNKTDFSSEMDYVIYYMMVEMFKGKKRAISYSRLLKMVDKVLGGKYVFKTKDSLRAYLNGLFKKHDNTGFTLISTANGVFVAENKEEIVECANRLRRHALGELKRYAELMKLPLDYQYLIDFDSEEIKNVNRS